MTEEKDWGKIFDSAGVQNGCVIVKDQSHDKVYYYNKEECIKRVCPASTFKIFNSLVSLETGVMKNDEQVIRWDGVVRSRAEWNKDMTLREAIKVSCVPCYQQIARSIGTERMQHYLDTVNYGNKYIGNAIDQFWLNDSLKISADEQVGFIKRLYFDELPFTERSQRIVRSMLLQEETDKYKLYYKTGTTAPRSDGSTLYWIVGYVEKIVNMKNPEDHYKYSDRIYPLFFAQHFESRDTAKDWMAGRKEILKKVLGI